MTIGLLNQKPDELGIISPCPNGSKFPGRPFPAISGPTLGVNWAFFSNDLNAIHILSQFFDKSLRQATPKNFPRPKFVLNDSKSVGYLAFVELHFLERRGFFILRPSHGSDREILYGCFLSGSSHSDVGVGLFSQIGLHLFFVAETGRLLRLFEALVFAELLEGDRRSPG